MNTYRYYLKGRDETADEAIELTESFLDPRSAALGAARVVFFERAATNDEWPMIITVIGPLGEEADIQIGMKMIPSFHVEGICPSKPTDHRPPEGGRCVQLLGNPARQKPERDTMSNERPQVMPKHCGNCIFHDWEDTTSICFHPHKVRFIGEELKTEIADMSVDNGMSAYGIADSLLADAIEAQEWQPYDSVCDHWRGRECKEYPASAAEERKVRDEARMKFEKLVESMMPNPEAQRAGGEDHG